MMIKVKAQHLLILKHQETGLIGWQGNKTLHSNQPAYLKDETDATLV